MSEFGRIVFGPPSPPIRLLSSSEERLRQKNASLERDIARLREGIQLAREMWLEENDPKDGTDCVTPFDEFLY